MPAESERPVDDEPTGLTHEERESAAARAVEQVVLTLETEY